MPWQISALTSVFTNHLCCWCNWEEFKHINTLQSSPVFVPFNIWSSSCCCICQSAVLIVMSCCYIHVIIHVCPVKVPIMGIKTEHKLHEDHLLNSVTKFSRSVLCFVWKCVCFSVLFIYFLVEVTFFLKMGMFATVELSIYSHLTLRFSSNTTCRMNCPQF